MELIEMLYHLLSKERSNKIRKHVCTSWVPPLLGQKEEMALNKIVQLEKDEASHQADAGDGRFVWWTIMTRRSSRK
ncbi:hypothetical protein Bca52824_066011 [Brassica carinata]|uniref:Uncharacterized protein n=1 Tax=Brassica carinata TaxID=52824 RepID=A0A8X7UBJ7_BRACI|nr:hypothetical protein Bca52824_066011 [Brassica carinata]